MSRFDELPEVMARLADGSLPALCHTISYASTWSTVNAGSDFEG